jgi:hypothetical protein
MACAAPYKSLTKLSGLFYDPFSTVDSQLVLASASQLQKKSKEGTAMLMEPNCCQSDLSSRCSVCGRDEELFELPGSTEKYCLGCSADLATATLLTAEIDAATLAGQNVSPLVSEFEQLGARILARSQSAELGSF